MRHTDETKRRMSEAQKGRPIAHHAKTVASRVAHGGNPPHATAARYKGSRARAGCRCEECRTAQREYKRARTQANRPVSRTWLSEETTSKVRGV
jgi:hypothetical protein